jgi:hypothetical protein
MSSLANSVTGKAGTDLSPDDQRRGFRMMVLSTMVGFIGDEVFGGNILMIIALHFKATEGYIGLLWFLILSSSLAQLFIVGIAQQRSKKILLYIIYGGAAFICLPVLGLNWMSGYKGPGAALILLAGCVGLRQTVYNLAIPCWMVLLRQMTPVNKRGRWLGLLRTAWQGSLVLTLVLTGLYLGRHPEWSKLQIMVFLGILAQVIRTLCLIPVPSISADPPAGKGGLWEMILTPVRDKTFQPFLLYTAFWGLAVGLQEGFRLVYLIRLGFGQNLALVCSSLTALGAVTTLFLWGRLADRFGNHGVFSLSLAGFAIGVGGWLFVSGYRGGLILAMVLFFAGGVFSSGNGLVQTRYLFGSLKPGLEASYLAVTFLVLQQATGIGALLGGQVLTFTQKFGFRIGEPGLNNYHIIFLLSALMFLVPWFLRRRIKEPTDSPTRHVIAVVLQPIRNLVGSVVLWAKGQDNNEEGG